MPKTGRTRYFTIIIADAAFFVKSEKIERGLGKCGGGQKQPPRRKHERERTLQRVSKNFKRSFSGL